MIGKKVRILLLLISPLMLIVYFIIFLLALQGYFDYQRKYRFADNEVIERITGVAFPEVDIIEYKKDNEGFLGDYKDELTLGMEDELSESIYHYLDSIISAGNTEWSKHDDEYSYSIIWGNGFPAPKGEDDEEDIEFYINLFESFIHTAQVERIELGNTDIPINIDESLSSMEDILMRRYG